jgi:MFS family permease
MRSRSHLPIIACYMVGPSLVLAVFSAFTLWALPWANEFGVPLRSVMLVYFVTALLATALMPFVGRLVLRIAPLKLMITGALWMGAGLLISSTVTSFALLAVVYSLSIAGGVLLCGSTVVQSLAIGRFPDHAGTIGGMMMIGWALCASLIPVSVMPILTAAGWRVALAVIGGTVLVVIPLICWALLRTSSAAQATTTTESDGGVAHRAITTGQLLSSWQFWVILFALLPMDIVQVGVDQNMAPFLTDLHVSPAVASYVLSAKAMGLAIGALLVGGLADRLDPRIVWSAASGISILSLLVIGAAPPVPLVCAALVTVGLTAGGIVPLISVLLVRAFGSEGYPPAAGLFCLFMLPSQLGPYAAGWVRDGLGSYQAVFLIGAAVIVVGAVAVWQFKGRPEPAPLVDYVPEPSV